MSIEYVTSNIERTQRELESLHGQLADEAHKEAQRTERLHRLNEEATRATSASTVKSKLQEASRVSAEVVGIQKKKADISRKIANKTQELHKYQQELTRLQGKERTGLLESAKRQTDELKRLQRQALEPVRRLHMPGGEAAVLPADYDAFICHASEDKDDLVRPLAEGLMKLGHKIWYDEFQLRVGDSLRRSIDKGLARSRFGNVVLSPSFFAKNWPQYELDGLVAKEVVGGKVILPVWHRVTKDDVIGYSPTLADRVALNTSSLSLGELVAHLHEAINAADA